MLAAFRILNLNLVSLPGILSVSAMLLAIAVVYWEPVVPDSMLLGLDYMGLHVHRMRFAREALLSSTPTLPDWYPREFLGTPFWSNVQNFPFIPSRLLLLLTMDPAGPLAYWVAVVFSAVLAALFTYLYLRKIGFHPIGSAAAGWTFACNGFYAARIAAGHLPLLEAYPALPLLLWVSESLIQARNRGESIKVWLGALTFSSASVMLAGHPQLSAYALGVVGFYLVTRCGINKALRISVFVFVGAGIAAFALIPMGMLIGRSTRLLRLAVPDNDVSMPYARLLAFFSPWRDGAPRPLGRAAFSPFEGYPNWAYFWETVSYAGLLPWLALTLLIWFVVSRKLNPSLFWITKFILTLAIAGIVLSLPVLPIVKSLFPGTIFRSPARFIYLTEFALALALGIVVHLTLLQIRTRISRFTVLGLLIMHIWDVGGHSREFIVRVPNSPRVDSEVIAEAMRTVADGRVAMDYRLSMPVNRTIDDIGFFDSIMLAQTYRMLLSIGNLAADVNIQAFDGSETSSRALAAMGVEKVITVNERQDLMREKQMENLSVYNVPSPSKRAEFFDDRQVQYLSLDQIHAILRSPNSDLASVLLLLRDAAPRKLETKEPGTPPVVEYRRPDSDNIEVSVDTSTSGYVRVIEAWDPGWSATVNGAPATVIPAMDALLAVALPAGRHQVRFVYRTPGARIGAAVSIASLVLFFSMIWRASKRDWFSDYGALGQNMSVLKDQFTFGGILSGSR